MLCGNSRHDIPFTYPKSHLNTCNIPEIIAITFVDTRGIAVVNRIESKIVCVFKNHKLSNLYVLDKMSCCHNSENMDNICPSTFIIYHTSDYDYIFSIPNIDSKLIIVSLLMFANFLERQLVCWLSYKILLILHKEVRNINDQGDKRVFVRCRLFWIR